jgi:E3 ubiquitin-protein ligase UBR4
MGKIKDVTFMYDVSNNKSSKKINNELDELNDYKLAKFIIIMSSCGYLYYEEMNEISSAKNGIYYITNTIEIDSKVLNSFTGTVNSSQTNTSHHIHSCSSSNSNTTSQFGGGVSVYYSFKLKMLFWSYQQGKTFIGTFKPHSLSTIDKISHLSFTSVKSTPIGGQVPAIGLQQALCSWSEIHTHPGLVMAMTLLSNNPVILMFLPDKIYIQEIKMTNNHGGPSKAKIQDMVATRHLSSSSFSASHEDGSQDEILCHQKNSNIYCNSGKKILKQINNIIEHL